MKLICQNCKVEISKQVTELKNFNLLTDNNGQDYIPEGFFIVKTKGSIIINIKDLINSNYHPNRSRLNGCCGYDGCEGVNRICINNHEIGTEMSDCWMPHYLELNPELVSFSVNQ